MAASVAVAIAASAGVSLVIHGIRSLFGGKRRKRSSSSSLNPSDPGTTFVNTCTSNIVLPVVYGRMKVGVNWVFKDVGVDTRLLHMVGNICEGEINGVAYDARGKLIFLNKDTMLQGNLAEHVACSIALGTKNQDVNRELQEYIPGWTDPKRNTAYIYARVLYNRDFLSSIPEISLVIEGKKVFDPGTGQRAWSRNPALCTYDFLVTSSERGGMGISPERIDKQSVIDAANYCNRLEWACDICLNTEQPAIDSLEELLATWHGAVTYSADRFRLRYYDFPTEKVSSRVVITENDIACDDNGISTLRIKQSSIADMPNALRIEFCNRDRGGTF